MKHTDRPYVVPMVPAGAKPAARRGTTESRLRAAQRALRDRTRQLKTLADIARAANATLEPQKVIELILAKAHELMPIGEWTLILVGPRAGEASPPVDPGTAGEAAMVNAAARLAADQNRPLVIPDVRRDSRLAAAAAGAPRGVACIPLVSRGHTVAVLASTEGAARGMARARDLATISALFEPAAVALENALRFQRAEQLSVTDDLTRLYNSRFLNMALGREVKRASRSGRSLSLLFLDLDGFKHVNDSHGHLVGSRTLVEVGGILRVGARETDIVARFGGDEFALILPDTGSGGAVAVAERIRERIAEARFLAADGYDIHLTASVGIVTFPDVALSAEEMMKAADAAMYRVKERGKNGVEVAQG